MSVVRVYKNPDNTVSIVRPAPKARRKKEDGSMETDSEFLDRVSKRAVKGTPLEGASFKDIDDSMLPLDRKDRNKWRWDTVKGAKVDPSIVLPHEAKANIETRIDAEMAKPRAQRDPMLIIELQEKLRKRDYSTG